MIALEIVITLVATFVIALITLLLIQRSASLRATLTHSLEVLELAKRLNCNEADFKNLIKKRLEPFYLETDRPFITSAKLLGQLLFGMAVFIGFTWWSLYLIKQGYAQWAVLSGIFALIGMVIPFIAWIGYKQRSEAMQQLMVDLNRYEKSLAEKKLSQSNKEPDTQAGVLIAKIVPEVIPAIEAAAEIVPEIIAAAEAMISKVKYGNKNHQLPEKTQKIPQDSILKRHYLGRLRTEIESGLPPCPSDSVLRRHYDQLIAAEMEKRMEKINA
ncbi:conserved membrane hypothetical protein [Candidatus Methylobacter favarea]|uniref:Uncharacterized protein n=1 Tax=Candidatus Methylobacter favarea TaxID=2707345 RepID=A0A8S0W9Q9_9GAMM|nr:hypothetical protein [Candidatus Methylobacter favarea]CAA9890156.1 conserved membrane hypothetical protein [Candidatus Methylobacter favarea]